LLIGSTVADMANGDVQRWADIASLTALIFAGMALLAYLLRLSGIINFISETVLIGFKAGAALTIILTQLPKLFGDKGISTISAAYRGSRGKIARSRRVRGRLQIVKPAIEPGASTATRSQREIRAPSKEPLSSGFTSSAVMEVP